MIEIFNEEKHFEPSDNVETELYNGFFSNADRNNMAILRTLPAEKLTEHNLTFEDNRINALLFHFRARHFYKTLTRAEQIKWQKYRQQKLEKSAVQFVQDLQRLAEQNADNPKSLELLQQLYDYGMKLLG